MSPLSILKTSPKRVLVKLSGEVLLGEKSMGIDAPTLMRIAQELKDLMDLGLQVCVVVGGGNLFRGADLATTGINRSTSDYMGMLATVMNALALQNALKNYGVSARVQSALPIEPMCEPFHHERAIDHLHQNRLVIFASGTGNPYFTTDTAAVLRAKELECHMVLKGTKVDGVYSHDPLTQPNATHFKTLSHEHVLQKHLKVMDMTAILLAQEGNLPILVFSILKPNNMVNVIQGHGTYTMIQNKEDTHVITHN